MKASFLQTCLLLFCVSTTIFSVPSAAVMKGAYWPSYRELPLSSIDTRYYTHIYYAFLVPDNTFKFNINTATAQSLRDFTTTLHAKNPPIKTLCSIGGGGGDELRNLFARIASTPSNRNTFIASAIKVARDYGFDGMDLDWESPRDQTEMGYFSSLIDDWRVAIVRESQTSGRPQLLLTAAVYFASRFLFDNRQSWPIASINKNMDWINAMCYDFHGEWDTSATGAPAALYDPRSNVSTSYGLQSWIQAGLLKNKLVMGTPLYGKTWTLRDPRVSGVGAPAVGIGPSGDGGVATLLYYEIAAYIANNNARVVLDLPTGSAYAVNGNIWIGYDSTNSTVVKVRYAQSQGILGYFFWALTFDLNSQVAQAASNAWTSNSWTS